ncbi:GGDEF domain-containing protein [Steroidobacter sp.]|uniref:GGDEF domain-containing protein n=1 Tax=Steroidobacter sp. TaxID=1978227 RepID=UPI001A4F33C5|nr:GGDEF domain-containing protein [Steroidobacter sp.]MBL8271368.1 diguanylate cyclase [Steroidobacter sp.]
MRYRESKDRSAELLRLTLPLMAQQSAAYHPHSYTIWYEHTAGINPRLSSVLEQSLQKGVPLGDEDIWRLYANYVIARDAEAMERMQQQIQAILTDTASAASTAEQEATQFSQTLVSHRNQLQEPTAAHQLPTIVSELIAETERMRVVAEDLSEQLERSAQKVTELTEQLEQAEHQALLDPLTQLLNRRGFEQRLRAYIQDNGSLGGAVMLVADIDHFKTINDTYGHVLGDKVIRSVAEVICGNIKGRDVAARIGGEEFAIFLPDTGVAGATALANHIRAAMGSRTIRRSGLEKPVDRVTLSVGIAAASAKVQTVEALLDCADKAMYAGKRAGRNRVEVFELSDSPALA